ncbi:MAG: hypothetical protein Q9175_007532 [Cornicularia normoerica]
MDKHASSSHSHPETSTDATSISEAGSSASAVEQDLSAWAQKNAAGLLKAIADWKRAKTGGAPEPSFNTARLKALTKICVTPWALVLSSTAL